MPMGRKDAWMCIITLCVSTQVCMFHNICEDELTKWEIVNSKLKTYNYANYL